MATNVKKTKMTKGLSINNLASFIFAHKKYADGTNRKKAEEKWRATVDNRSKVIQKPA